MLFSASGDRLAVRRRKSLLIKRELDNLTHQLKNSSGEQLATLRSGFRKEIASALQLCIQTSDNKNLNRWALRLCNDYVQFSPELAALSEKALEAERVEELALKVGNLSESLLRCWTILASQRIRRAITAADSPVKRFLLRRRRRKVLFLSRVRVLSKRSVALERTPPD